ncbi:alpha/beta fold hydrolase [Geochorda subterranea]|uniref:Alpha/beta hydrolase n=1 Tax=Geochorda subterranea TaxID=3109564 RepID=A0ABZ1BRW8_9FIRM|nr:alpha/beta hydrolase [Limnochorda sp. LNt]WRP15552.1 alpha/beta hydrolase [Limnochorda sp. LNt]
MPVKSGRLLCWRWGSGPDLVVLPGIMEALLERRALAGLMQRLWGVAARRYRLTLLSAREAVPPGFTTEQMAQDVAEAVAVLGLDVRLTVGMDAGGLVAQWLGVRWPQQAGALALISTPLAGRTPDGMARFLDHLERLLRADSWLEAFEHATAVYLDPALRHRARLPLALLRRWGRPAEMQRGIRLLTAYRHHDMCHASAPLQVPVLQVAGGMDPLVGQEPPGAPGKTDGPVGGSLRPSRQVWLAGEHGAHLHYWEIVLAELERFEQERRLATARSVAS